MTISKTLGRAFRVVFEYETLKIVSINSKKVGLLCRFIQLVIVAYVIGFVIVYKKGYQESDTGQSGLISKVKGVSQSNRSIAGRGNVWDVADYVVPPQEKDALFITTNALITRKQTQSTCPEDPDIPGVACKSDKDCVKDEAVLLGNGVKTGKCDKSTKTCKIFAWCPVESSKEDIITQKSPLLTNVGDYTILVKNSLEFPKFKVLRNNIPPYYNKSRLKTCRYHPKNDLLCPIFTISTILNYTSTDYDEIATLGGIISFNINWDCNLDFDANKCYPTYSFKRLDPKNTNISKGWNFRYANYYYFNGTQYRDLIKAYGIRVLFSVKSKAGKFNIMPLTMNIGSGVALLGIATVICDFIVLYCLKKGGDYQKAKYHKVSGDDAYKPFDSDNENNLQND